MTEATLVTPAATAAPKRPLSLGLRVNWRQFSLLVLVNAFVGGMVGIERSVVPLIARDDFRIASTSVVLSFVLTFGLVKALSNLFAGRLADRVGRKSLLVAGWVIGAPAPLIVILAPSWSWVVFANVLLGINQGLCWSTTVIMKIDLVGPARRGLAMGLNEAAGYLAVSLSALAAGFLAATYALRPQPFLLGIAFAALGLLISLFLVRETWDHARYESTLSTLGGHDVSFATVFRLVSWQSRTLFSVSQAGLTNNLNDGLAWGLLPLYFAGAGLSISRIGVLAAVYPAVWGISQLGTGALSDHVGRKPLIVVGMLLQSAAIGLLLAHGFLIWLVSMCFLGFGTALVYPTLLAAVGDAVSPLWRASAVGVYRLWRDSGYVVGALLAGVIADAFGMRAAIGVVAVVTAISGIFVASQMRETLVSKGGSMLAIEI